MSLDERINTDYVAAYKAKDALRLSVLRLIKTAVKNQLVELRRPGGSLDDAEMLEVILREAKQRRDSIEQYTNAGRSDLADKEAAELAILREYLPAALSAEEIAQAIETAIAEIGASGPRDMGRVISAVMAANKGRADGKEIAQAVKQRLA